MAKGEEEQQFQPSRTAPSGKRVAGRRRGKRRSCVHTHGGGGSEAEPKRAWGNEEKLLTRSRRYSQDKDFREKYGSGTAHLK